MIKFLHVNVKCPQENVKKATKNIHENHKNDLVTSIVVSEEMLAEGMKDIDEAEEHPDKDLLTSDIWGSYFYCPRTPRSRVAATHSNFRNMSASVSRAGSFSRASTPGLKRVQSMKSAQEIAGGSENIEAESGAAGVIPGASATPPTTGPLRINTLWGTLIRDHARMCIPDLDALIDYPIDYRFPAFGWTKKGDLVSSGFFPADPKSLHT